MSDSSKRAWLKPVLKPVRPVFREVLAMSAFVNIMALAVPVFTLQTYDRVIGHAGISTLFGFIIGMIFVVIFDYILRVSRSRIMQTVALRIDVLVGHKLFNKLMELPLQALEGRPASFWQALFRDVDTVRNTVSGAAALLICDLPFFFMFLTIIWLVAAPIAWVLLIIIPLFVFIAWRSQVAMAEANQEERQTMQTRDGLIAEMIQGRTTIKALALDDSMRPMWADRHAENIENSLRRGSKSDFWSSAGGSLTMSTTIFMTSVGAWAIINGAITMGALVATNMLTGRLIGPLNQLVGQWRTYSNFFQAVDRLGEVFSMASERTVSEISLSRPQGEIGIENVTFSYAEDLSPVLENVSYTIKARGVHALVGRNGSGKTTLMKIIQGLYTPSQGRVLLDGADIAQFSRKELAHWIGYVPQETILFTGTVRDNIIHRIPEASDEDIIKAATAAGVHHFIIDLPDGYASDIGEAGRRLSGGQRQRIAVARALLGDPPVVLLDEPSASLDRQAETALRETLVEIGRERTVIIVTHSPIMLAACDDLVALDKGKVALAGPSKEILPRLFGQQPQGAGAPAPAPAQPRGTVPEELPKPVEGPPAPRPPAAAPPPRRHRRPQRRDKPHHRHRRKPRHRRRPRRNNRRRRAPHRPHPPHRHGRHRVRRRPPRHRHHHKPPNRHQGRAPTRRPHRNRRQNRLPPPRRRPDRNRPPNRRPNRPRLPHRRPGRHRSPRRNRHRSRLPRPRRRSRPPPHRRRPDPPQRSMRQHNHRPRRRRNRPRRHRRPLAHRRQRRLPSNRRRRHRRSRAFRRNRRPHRPLKQHPRPPRPAATIPMRI